MQNAFEILGVKPEPLKYGTVCTGLCAPTVAWQGMGWQPQFFSEISPFPSAVLKHHYPAVPNLGDMNHIHEKKEFKQANIDILCGGTPCQSFSVAGLRAGLDDPRGNLALVFLKLVDSKRPRWVVWENVPGVLSSTSHNAPNSCEPPQPVDLELDGQEVEITDEYTSEEVHAFNSFLAGLQQLGYGVAYRVFDAQYFGLAQRRKRVFVVGYLGNWRPAAAVLFDTQSMCWNPAPQRQTGTGFASPVAQCLDANYGRLHGVTNQDQAAGFTLLVPEISPTIKSGVPKGDRGDGTDNLLVMAHAHANAEICNDGSPALLHRHEAPILIQTAHTQGNGLIAGHSEVMHTLEATNRPSVAILPFDTTQVTSGKNFSNPQAGDPCHPLAKNQHVPSIALTGKNTASIRRLTPVECERLQGFPDNYTKIAYKRWPADKCPDGPRYEAIGNAMPVPVLKYIGERISLVSAVLKTHTLAPSI